MKFTENLCKINTSGNRGQILKNMTVTIVRHCKMVFGGIWFGLGVYACWPCYDFFINGNYTLVSPLLMPFVDETSLNGYLILMLVNIYTGGIAGCGTYTYSCLFLTYVDVYDGLLSLIEYDFELFDRMHNNKKRQLTTNRSGLFRNIMMELMDLAR